MLMIEELTQKHIFENLKNFLYLFWWWKGQPKSIFLRSWKFLKFFPIIKESTQKQNYEEHEVLKILYGDNMAILDAYFWELLKNFPGDKKSTLKYIFQDIRVLKMFSADRWINLEVDFWKAWYGIFALTRVILDAYFRNTREKADFSLAKKHAYTDFVTDHFVAPNSNVKILCILPARFGDHHFGAQLMEAFPQILAFERHFRIIDDSVVFRLHGRP